MAKNIRYFYEFGPFQIDIENRQLLRGGVHVPLTPKAFKLLLVLVENAGEVIGKDALLKSVWQNTSVASNIISVNMAALRKALEDGVDGYVYITTVSKRGYQFVAPVQKTVGDATLPREELRLGGHFWYALASCGIYASHYLIALLLEVAYKFNIYGLKAVVTAPLFFGWILITSVLGLAVSLKASLKGKGVWRAAGAIRVYWGCCDCICGRLVRPAGCSGY